MPLTALQLDRLRTQGFVNAGPIFGDAELETIRGEYDRLVTMASQTLGNDEEGRYPYRAMLNFRSPSLKGVVSHPDLLEVATQVLGEDVRFWWDQGINKSPGAGSFIAWHQDNGYTSGRTQEYLTCWLALDDSTLENGGLQVIPGSHRSGCHEHELHGVHYVIDEGRIETDKAVPLDAKAGDVLFFSSLLVHQTVGNRTADRQRRAWVVQYCRGDMHNAVTGEVYDNRPWVVRGGEVLADPYAERRFDLRGDRP